VPEQGQGQGQAPSAPSFMGHLGSLVMETFEWNWRPLLNMAVFFKYFESR